jgi:oligosaccharyl transferase (archaeosortase A-associated)
MSLHLPNQSLISKIIPESNSRHFFLLLVLGAIMLFIRISPIYIKVFTNWPGGYGDFVSFSADDAIYHMRFVHNTLRHFPSRVFFDPFTHFPFGSQTPFGPLFTFIIAATAWIAGFGNPSPALTNHVAAYVPPIMGALCLIPVYFIARKMFGKTTAILAAFVLTFLPGEFLNRSALGFVDHHIAEVLFSTAACAFLIYALNASKTMGFQFSHIKHKKNHPTLFYGLLTGITFGLFILVWQGALMFGAIFLIFFITQLLIDHFKNNNTDYLLVLASLTYIPPIIIVLPYILKVPLTLYPSNNIFVLAIMLALFSICYLLHITLRVNKLSRNLYPLALAAVFISIALVLKYFFPQTYSFMYDGCKLLFNPTPGMSTISEVHPSLFGRDGKLTTQLFWDNLFWAMPLAIIGFGILVCRAYEKARPTEVFLLIWTLAILASACAQIRFNYYLAINAALLAGYTCYLILELISDLRPKIKFCIKIQKFCFSTFFFVFALFIIDPIIMLLMDHTVPSGIHVSHEWYDTLIWLKKHTPDPQGKIINKNFDYAAGNYPVPKNLNSHYKYPKSAYGVMSWWDVGHQITYIAERIPNANPFQQGIIENNGKTGAALFFTSTNENKAVRNLNKIGTKYIIITNGMAFGKFRGMGIWANDTKGWSKFINIKTKLSAKKTAKLKVPIDSPKFLQSMMNRLFYNDANGLQHFRLIYETESDYRVHIRRALVKKPDTIKISSSNLLFKSYNKALSDVRKINRILINKDKGIYTYSARPPVKEAKIFEKVKGATISGNVPNDIVDNTHVKLILKLKTKYGRIFTYKQITKVNKGKYKFVVPYPTTYMRGDGYSYDIKPIGNYKIQINDRIIKVFVPEKAVMLGKQIKAA